MKHPIYKARCAFVFAHPGHELKIHAWLETLKPTVFLLTDGSGSGGEGRVALSQQTIAASGAVLDPISAPWRDRQAYELILKGYGDQVITFVQQLAAKLQRSKVDYVICDSIEGFNPVHDLCGVIAFNACRLVEKQSGKRIACFDFPLDGRPNERVALGSTETIVLSLSNEQWQHKLAAANSNVALQKEVVDDFARYGESAFKEEVLAPVVLEYSLNALAQEKPFYETYGEDRVQAGVYDYVLRYREHFMPLVDQINDWVQSQ